MFSLCIPTMDRFDKFLFKYLPKYLENNYINEIVISDENGNDIKKIQNTFTSNKLKLFKNESKLGPFLNKINACSKANNEWIALIDSDNFVDETYFIIAIDYIKLNNLNKNVILAPCFAKPNFNFSHLSGFVYKKGSFNENKILETTKINKNFISSETLLMNTGNYIINKYFIDNLNLKNESENIKMSSACDVIYFNTLLFEQFDLHMHVVPNLEYEHVVHNGSIYLQTCSNFREFNSNVHKRYNNLN